MKTRILLTVVVSALLAWPAAAAQDTSISVTIRGAAQLDGPIICRLFDEDHWLDAEIARASTTPTKSVVKFEGLAAGDYAVACFHDTDGNGKLTFGLFWRPKEGSGFSRGYRPVGPPKFKKAAFAANGATNVPVTLSYP